MKKEQESFDAWIKPFVEDCPHLHAMIYTDRGRFIRICCHCGEKRDLTMREKKE